jgi:phosphatidylserine/phosphatidylglycerophosphate/cardiolipin synthase-like enzyme
MPAKKSARNTEPIIKQTAAELDALAMRIYNQTFIWEDDDLLALGHVRRDWKLLLEAARLPDPYAHLRRTLGPITVN